MDGVERLRVGIPVLRQPRHDFGMIWSAMRDGRAFTDLDVAMLRLAHGGVIRRVRDIDHQGHIRLEGVGDLPRTQTADLFLNVGYDADFGVEFAPLPFALYREA